MVSKCYVETPKGAGAFMDSIQHLTHEHELDLGSNKKIYSDDRVKANFDFRKEIIEKEKYRYKNVKSLNRLERMRRDVLYNGKTLKQCSEKDYDAFQKDCDRLKKYRIEYLQKEIEPPALRITYFIDAKGGDSKLLAARELARMLYSDTDEIDGYYLGNKARILGQSPR